MFYSQQQLTELDVELATVIDKCHALRTGYYCRRYRTARGEEFAVQGLLRRLGTLQHCIQRVFTLLPPALESIPTTETREDATIALQAFIFNVFGCMDNLAWVWVEEKMVRKADGTPLGRNAIGLGVKYVHVRQSLSDSFRAYLETREGWFDHLEGYRHALAHRVPLYIPPHAVSPKDRAAYSRLEQLIGDAIQIGSVELEADLAERQQALTFFRPWMVHSFQEQAPIVVIHPQMLADFNTVDEVARRMLDELNQL